MEGVKIVLLFLAASLFAIPYSFGISEPCKMVYIEDGIRAVLQSSECSHWITFNQPFKNRTRNCQFSRIHGRYGRYDYKDDDRLSCNLDLQIPFPGKNGHEEVRVGVVAVFDGHNGYEASEMASKLLLDYFSLHSTFIADEERLQFEEEHVMVAEEPNKDEKPGQYNSNLVSSNGCPSVFSDESRHMGILKEALLRTIRDIDLAFSEEAVTKNLRSGSTATVAVLVHGHLLVASVGHPKALLCSEKVHSHEEMEVIFGSYLSPKELTRDHPPTREDERARLLPADGFVFTWRDGPLADDIYNTTRAIGLTDLKSYGFIAEHEVRDWQPLTANDSYLVVATGIFQRLTPQNVCDLLPISKENEKSQHCFLLTKESDCIYYTAVLEGDADNLSVIVVPLRSAGFTHEKI